MIDLDTPITRTQMKALPIEQLTRSGARRGDLTILYIARETSVTKKLYSLLSDISRHYRAVADDPQAVIIERHIRGIWSRLVDRSRGYWLNGCGFREYSDA